MTATTSRRLRGILLPRSCLLFAVVVMGVVACSQQTLGTPSNLQFRTFLKEVYHPSPLTYRLAFNTLVVREVWSFKPTLYYDTIFSGEEYRGERDSCRIEPIILTAASIDQGLYPLVEDSGWFVTQVLPSGQPSSTLMHNAFSTRSIRHSTA